MKPVSLALAAVAAFSLGHSNGAAADKFEVPRPPSREILNAEIPATLTVKVTFDGAGKWSNPRSGARSDMTFHRSLSYSIPLIGKYAIGPDGFQEITQRDMAEATEANGFFIPDFERYLVFVPREQMTAGNAPCGRGAAHVHDKASGMAVGDPGSPPLVPFKRDDRHDGTFPAERKARQALCANAVALDHKKRVAHVRLHGHESAVKVTRTVNGLKGLEYDMNLNGRFSNDVPKFEFFDVPFEAGATSISDTRVFERYSRVSGDGDQDYPLNARVQWKLTVDGK